VAGKVPDREQKRTAILQAAREVFAHRGYEPATLEAVARGAGLAKGTLYLYFRNKEDLYFHTAIHVLESLQACILEQAQRSSGALDRLRAIAVGQFDFFLRHRNALQLLAPFSNPGMTRLHRRLIAALMERWAGHVQRITALVEEGQRTGTIRRDLEAGHIGLAFIGMTSQAAQALVRRGQSEPPLDRLQPTAEGMADAMMKILLEGVKQR
jgi:AcrR family transcriptional regulator